MSNGLRQFTSAGQGAGTALGALNTAATGHDGLASAARGFAEEWSYSLTKIGENAAALAGKLGVSADGYTTAEEAIIQAAGGGQQ